MLKRVGVFALVVGAVAAGTGCSTPRTAPGTLEQGKERVVQLVLDVVHTLPSTVQFDPPTEVGTQTCRRTIAGYAVGKTGAHRAEVPLIVYTPAQEPLSSLLGRIEAAWTAAGYRIDRSRIHESRFPQVRAHVPSGDDVVVTAFVTPFVVKQNGERYPDYERRARAAGIRPAPAGSWTRTPVGTELKDTLLTTQLDLYSVSQCLRGS